MHTTPHQRWMGSPAQRQHACSYSAAMPSHQHAQAQDSAFDHVIISSNKSQMSTYSGSNANIARNGLPEGECLILHVVLVTHSGSSWCSMKRRLPQAYSQLRQKGRERSDIRLPPRPETPSVRGLLSQQGLVRQGIPVCTLHGSSRNVQVPRRSFHHLVTQHTYHCARTFSVEQREPARPEALVLARPDGPQARDHVGLLRQQPGRQRQSSRDGLGHEFSGRKSAIARG